MREASFYRVEDGHIRCELCNHYCKISLGHRGLCGVRENIDGVLYSLVYGKPIARNLDPIEKKPLYHFLPGSLSYSIATLGCNFRCLHCQNYEISQLPTDANIMGFNVSPDEIVADALSVGALSISYTYTEPTIFMEYAMDVAETARKNGLKNVFVSNGYMSEEALLSVAPLLDAINVDLKGDKSFYKNVCKAELDPVKRNIERLWDLGVHVEVTTLIIPGYNSSKEILGEIAAFLANISPNIPWHVSAFYPTYKLTDAPRTKVEHLRLGIQIGHEAGLRYVYAGNIPGEGEDTRCHVCDELLVERYALRTMKVNISDGKCPHCGTVIPGVW